MPSCLASAAAKPIGHLGLTRRTTAEMQDLHSRPQNSSVEHP
jgi:hypothetical protein